MFATTAGAAKSGGETDGVYIQRKGTGDDPVGQNDIDEVVNIATDKYYRKHESGMETDGLYISKPVIEENDLNLVGYGVYISPEGRASVFVGSAPDSDVYNLNDVSSTSENDDQVTATEPMKPDMEDVVSNIHGQMEKFKKERNNGGGLTPQASSNDWGGFDVDRNLGDPVGETKNVVGDRCPTGKVEETSKIYQHESKDNVFACASELDVVPGDSNCETKWKKELLKCWHQWQSGSFDTGEVKDTAPVEDNGGSSSYSMSASYSGGTPSVSIGATVTIPSTDITNFSNDDEGEWKYHFTSDDINGKGVYNVISFFEFNSSPTDGQQIVETETKARFDKFSNYGGRTFNDRSTIVYNPDK